MKAELGEKIMKEFAALRAKKSSYLTDNNDEDKKNVRSEKYHNNLILRVIRIL